MIFNATESYPNVSIKSNELNATVSVDKSTPPRRVSACSRTCSNLHIIYNPFQHLSVFVFIRVIDVCP